MKFRIFYTTTDLSDEYVDVRAIKHGDRLDGLATVSETVASHSVGGRDYFAGVNADFFSAVPHAELRWWMVKSIAVHKAVAGVCLV